MHTERMYMIFGHYCLWKWVLKLEENPHTSLAEGTLHTCQTLHTYYMSLSYMYSIHKRLVLHCPSLSGGCVLLNTSTCLPIIHRGPTCKLLCLARLLWSSVKHLLNLTNYIPGLANHLLTPEFGLGHISCIEIGSQCPREVSSSVMLIVSRGIPFSLEPARIVCKWSA